MIKDNMETKTVFIWGFKRDINFLLDMPQADLDELIKNANKEQYEAIQAVLNEYYLACRDIYNM